MTSVVVIQARTSSSRLPAKAFLPVNNIPMVVLTAKRASNSGKPVMVVTSRDASDDALCDLLCDFQISYFRGSLTNTLDRFVSALSGFSDDTIIFRLTADNIFPDGNLINELEDAFLKQNLKYLACNGPESGLPYGMSVEVIYLGDLRDANKNATTDYEREHVTPYIRRIRGVTYFKKYQYLKKGTYRCTVDTLEDYLAILKAFKQIDDPVSIPALKLVEYLVNSQEQPLTNSPISKFVIGSAQFGLNYGIANTNGRPSPNVIESIIKKAIVSGADYIDTARAYGVSESVIGRVLSQGWESRVKLITKLSPLMDCPSHADSNTIKAFVEASVYKSCAELNRKNLDCLMLHRASHYIDWDGNVWKTLLELNKIGVIKELGISIQDPGELDYIVNNKEISFIQMPFNIIDNRWHDQVQKIKALKKQRKINVHVRSAFLQGLLISEKEQIWSKVNCPNPVEVKKWLQDHAKKYNCKSVKELCLSYVRSMDWVDGIVIGMESVQQLQENIALFSAQLLSEQQIAQIHSDQLELSEDFLNPAKWNKT